MNGNLALNLYDKESLTYGYDSNSLNEGIVLFELTEDFERVYTGFNPNTSSAATSSAATPISNEDFNQAIAQRKIGRNIESWVSVFFQQLDNMRDLENNWDGYDSPPPNATALRTAQDVLNILHNTGFKPSTLSASVEAGITISFYHEKRYAVLECYNDGDVCSATYLSDSPPEVREVGNSVNEIKEVIENMNTFIYAS